MFVKIKLEDPGNSKNPLIFSIENNATIFDLKTNLESFVDIPADQQEIQRMDRILDNFDELSKVVNKEIDGDKINGAAISLYTNNKFFCFLQFYNKNESDNQTSFFSQPSDAKKLPIDQLPQYIEQLDSDTSWHSSSSETDSTDQSANSSDSSDDSRSPKRKSILKPNSPTKRLRDSTQDDKGCKPPSSTATPIRQTSPIQEISDPKISVPAQSGAILTSQIPKTVVVVEVAPQATVPFTNKVVEASTLESIQNPKEKLEAPYIAMKPEYRRYAVVINKNIDEQQPDYSHLMEHFYGLFESSRSCGRLNFSESLSVTAYDDQLWVLCEDNETCEWITKGTRILSSYKSSSFIKYFGLLKCRVVLPQVVEGKELANIFQLLELQNSGLSTTKWCVVERTMLDPESVEYASQAMTTLCKNEVLTLYLDRESECFILEKSCKLKYCFWKLTFQF